MRTATNLTHSLVGEDGGSSTGSGVSKDLNLETNLNRLVEVKACTTQAENHMIQLSADTTLCAHLPSLSTLLLLLGDAET